MIVMKFGGSSVESATAIERVCRIIESRRDRPRVVVVSAMGKTTNKLLAIAQLAVEGRRAEAKNQINSLVEFHCDHARKLVPATIYESLQRSIVGHFQELGDIALGLSVLGELTPRSLDAVASYGERLSSLIVAAALDNISGPAVHLDSRSVIITDRRFTQAAPILEETYRRLLETIPPLVEQGTVVMGGFIGSTMDGITSTLGRGGSDYTASIVGAGVKAAEIQIWTDVDGMLTTDPNLVPGVHRVKTISFEEAAELAYFGAKVLHPSTVLPAIERNIPVRILNSRRPQVEGTLIVSKSVSTSNVAKAISTKRNVIVLNIHSTRMLMAHGFLRRIFEVFDRFETPVDMVSTSEVSVSLTIDNPRHLDEIVSELEQFADVYVERDHAILCVVGDNIRHTPGIAGAVFDSLGEINVRMISQGASRLNISFVINNGDVPLAVERLHRRFFSQLDPAVFD